MAEESENMSFLERAAAEAEWYAENPQVDNEGNPVDRRGVPRLKKKKKYDGLRHAFKQSRKALKNAREKSISTLENYYNQGREDLAPWADYGRQSIADLSQGTQEYAEMVRDPSKYKESPGYQWQLEQGLGGVNRGAAMAGKLDSGQNQKDLMAYGQGLALQDYQNSLNRFQGLLDRYSQGAQMGQQAAGQLASMSGQMGANTSNVYQAYGNGAANLYWQMGQARGQQKQADAAQKNAFWNTLLGAAGMAGGYALAGPAGGAAGGQVGQSVASVAAPPPAPQQTYGGLAAPAGPGSSATSIAGNYNGLDSSVYGDYSDDTYRGA